MNTVKNKKQFFIKFISLAICFSLLFLQSVSSSPPQYILDDNKYYIENCSAPGFIEPVSTNSGSYVSPNGYNRTESQVWEFSHTVIGTTAYFMIKSSKGANLYLRFSNSGEGSTITVDNAINTENPSDNYLWKLERVDMGAFYDIYTIVSKANETKYLALTGSNLSLSTGLGSGREEATRYWKFNDITDSVKKIKVSHKTNGSSSIKSFTFANTYDSLAMNRYFGAYIDSGVINNCKQISNGNIYEYDRFNNRGLLEIIMDSSVCVINTHGSSNTLLCQNYEENSETYLQYNYINAQIPDNYFSNTKLVVLIACETAKGDVNVAQLLYEKGVETVVAFEQSIYFLSDSINNDILPNEGSLRYVSEFLKNLSKGKTVKNANIAAYDDIAEYYDELDTTGENEIYHKDGIYNLKSVKIYGNKNLSFP